MSKNLVIINSRASAVYLPSGKSEKVEEQRGLQLLPGENDVTEDYWKAIQSNPGVKIFVRGGVLKVKEGAVKAVPIVEDWDKITNERARKIAGALDDIKKLQDIKSKVKKKGVKDIIESRIDEILDANVKGK